MVYCECEKFIQSTAQQQELKTLIIYQKNKLRVLIASILDKFEIKIF
jgi:hypothetical protein